MVNSDLVQVIEALYEKNGKDRALAEIIINHLLDSGFMTPYDAQNARDAMDAYDSNQIPVNFAQIIEERNTTIAALQSDLQMLVAQLAQTNADLMDFMDWASSKLPE